MNEFSDAVVMTDDKKNSKGAPRSLFRLTEGRKSSSNSVSTVFSCGTNAAIDFGSWLWGSLAAHAGQAAPPEEAASKAVESFQPRIFLGYSTSYAVYTVFDCTGSVYTLCYRRFTTPFDPGGLLNNQVDITRVGWVGY